MQTVGGVAGIAGEEADLFLWGGGMLEAVSTAKRGGGGVDGTRWRDRPCQGGLPNPAISGARDTAKRMIPGDVLK